MKKLIAIVLICALTASGTASAACPTGSPDAVTSKAPKDAASDPKAVADAKGIAEDGQHTPMETDPNAPGVTKTEGGTTTNIAQAETEIAAAGTREIAGSTASTSTGTETTDPQSTACPQ